MLWPKLTFLVKEELGTKYNKQKGDFLSHNQGSQDRALQGPQIIKAIQTQDSLLILISGQLI